jgi:hypothetical protein
MANERIMKKTNAGLVEDYRVRNLVHCPVSSETFSGALGGWSLLFYYVRAGH